MSAAEGQALAKLSVCTLQGMCTEESFTLFFKQSLEHRLKHEQSLAPILAMESLLLNACNKQSYEDHFKILKASCYSADLDWDSLSHQLHLCADLISQELPTVKI